jgi:signal transduction histidine kinase
MALEPEVEESLYRLAQEALTNVVKHARASTVHVRLVWTETAGAFVKLEVSDDGVGFDAFLDRPGHLGLRMMAERTAKLGGTLHVESAPGRGTTVSAVIPQNRLGPILR